MAGKDEYALYKGRKYRLLYLGPTKFGKKAKLGFIGGTKEFWVDANLVTVTTGAVLRRPGRVREEDQCELCGKNKYTCGHGIGW